MRNPRILVSKGDHEFESLSPTTLLLIIRGPCRMSATKRQMDECFAVAQESVVLLLFSPSFSLVIIIERKGADHVTAGNFFYEVVHMSLFDLFYSFEQWWTLLSGAKAMFANNSALGK